MHHNRNTNRRFEIEVMLKSCITNCWVSRFFCLGCLFRLRSIANMRASSCWWTAISFLTSTIAWRRWRPSTPYRSAAVWPSPSWTEVWCFHVKAASPSSHLSRALKTVCDTEGHSRIIYRICRADELNLKETSLWAVERHLLLWASPFSLAFLLESTWNAIR